MNLNKLNFHHTDFSHLKMDGASLNAANLEHAILADTSLIRAQLENARLSHARLVSTNLRHANLFNAKLVSSNLLCADLRNADLTNANLEHAELFFTDLRKANLTNTKLKNTVFFTESTFKSLYVLGEDLDHIYKKILYQHPFFKELQHAVLEDLIKQSFTHEIPRGLIIRTLEAAYKHPAFSQHLEYHWLKTTASTIVSTFWGFFATSEAEKEKAAIPAHETEAQILIRIALDKHKPALQLT
jgi:uncharacterized protein YjbI with pentapeptide repeats